MAKKGNILNYWRIDVINPDRESDGYSLCVCTSGNENEDSIVNLCLDAGLIDRLHYTINAENITNDPYEMAYWSKYAKEV